MFRFLFCLFMLVITCSSKAQFTDARLLDYSQEMNYVGNVLQAVDYNGDGYLDLCQLGYDYGLDLPVLYISENVFGRRFVNRRLHLEENLILSNDVFFCDIDGNGLTDVLNPNGYSNPQVLYQNSPDEFTPGELGFGSPDYEIRSIIDFNDDGAMDLFLMTPNGSTSMVLLNDGFGNWSVEAEFPTTITPMSLSYETMQWKDFDNDEDLDLIASSVPNGSNMTFYWRENDSTSFEGNWNAFVFFPTIYADQDWEMADFNNDGILDIAIQNYNALAVYESSALDDFDLTYFDSDFDDLNIETIDMEGDGDQDITCGEEHHFYGSGFVTNNGSGGFPNSACVAGFDPRTVADFDNDGLNDIFLTKGQKTGAIKWNNGNGVFSDIDIIVEHQTWSFGLGFFPDGQGGSSFITSQSLVYPNSVNSYQISHSGELTYEKTIATMASSLQSRALPLADFDDDGFLDLIYYVNQPVPGATFYYRKGLNGYLNSPVEMFYISFEGDLFGSEIIDDARIFDQDNDGDLDLLIQTESGNADLYFAENNGSGFDDPVIIEEYPGNSRLVDIDQDGDCDVLGVSQLLLFDGNVFVEMPASILSDFGYYSPKANSETNLVEYYYVYVPGNGNSIIVNKFQADSLGYYSYVEYTVNDHPSMSLLDGSDLGVFLVIDLDQDGLDDILFGRHDLLFTLHGTAGGFEVMEDPLQIPAYTFGSVTTHKILAYDYDDDTDEDIFVLISSGWYVVENHHLEPVPNAFDLNFDGNVSVADLQMLLDNFGCIETCDELDLDGDGSITTLDISIFLGEIGN